MQRSLERELLMTNLISSAETSQLNVLQSSCFSFLFLYPSFLACIPVQSWMVFLAVV